MKKTERKDVTVLEAIPARELHRLRTCAYKKNKARKEEWLISAAVGGAAATAFIQVLAMI